MDTNNRQQPTMEDQFIAKPKPGYAFTGQIMLSVIVILFAVVVFMVCLHLYARWYVLRMRRRQLETRRRRHHNLQITIPGRGLELHVLNSLPVFVYSNSDLEKDTPECAVCLSEFEDNEYVRRLPKCNHSFHINCIDMWFHSHSTCPICRSSVEMVEETELGCSSDLGKGLQLGEVRIDVPAAARAESVNLNSPASRLLSLKRIWSMGRNSKSPRATTSGTELDSEIGESNRGQ